MYCKTGVLCVWVFHHIGLVKLTEHQAHSNLNIHIIVLNNQNVSRYEVQLWKIPVFQLGQWTLDMWEIVKFVAHVASDVEAAMRISQKVVPLQDLRFYKRQYFLTGPSPYIFLTSQLRSEYICHYFSSQSSRSGTHITICQHNLHFHNK